MVDDRQDAASRCDRQDQQKKNHARPWLPPGSVARWSVTILTTPRMQGTSPLPNHHRVPWRPRPGMRREGFGSLQVSMVGHRPSRHRDLFFFTCVRCNLFIYFHFFSVERCFWLDGDLMTRPLLDQRWSEPTPLPDGGRQTDPDPSPSGPRGCVWMAHARQRYMLGGVKVLGHVQNRINREV